MSSARCLIATAPLVVLAGRVEDGVNHTCEPEGAGTDHVSERTRTRADIGTTYTDAVDDEAAWLVSPPLASPRGALRVGVLVQLSEPGPAPAMEAQAVVDGAAVGARVPLEDDGFVDGGHRLGQRELGLDSSLSGLGIVTREGWGARPTRCTSRDRTKHRVGAHMGSASFGYR